MVDTDDTRWTNDDGWQTTPGVWHKLLTGELKKSAVYKEVRVSKDVGPPDKSGENPSSLMNEVAPSDQKSGNYTTLEFRHAAICNMMLRLKYIEGAKPGKKLKITPTPEETRSQKYEQHRKERQLNEKWKVGSPWLVFNAANNTMTCRVCIDHYIMLPGTYFYEVFLAYYCVDLDLL